MEEEKDKFKRLPAEEKFLAELTGREKRVSVIGSIGSVNEKNQSALFNDGTAEISVIFSAGQLPKIKSGATFRIIGKPVPGEKISLEAETVHELQDFDSALFERVRAVEKKVLK